MKSRVLVPLLVVVLLGVAPGSHARDGWRELGPDERREMRREMREHWHQERRQRDEGDRRWRSMEPDERQRLRDEMREHRRRPDDGGGRRGRGGD